MPKRIVYLTTGTGSYYCGTCMRDNALVVALRKLGHDATMLSLYMPMTLDEPSASEGKPILMGGINVYLQQKSSLFQKTPQWLDRWLDSPKLLEMAASRAGMTSPKDLAEVTISMLKGEEGRQIKEIDKLIDWLVAEGKPDVICLSNALIAGLARRLKEKLGVPVICSLQGEDSFLDSLPEPYKAQAWSILSERVLDCDALVPVSHYYGKVMQERLQYPPDRQHMIYNGILLDGYGPAEERPDPPVLGYLSRLSRDKGLDNVVEAFIILKKNNRIKNLKLHVTGTRTPGDEPFIKELQERLEKAGLTKETTFLPPVDRNGKIEFLKGLSALSVPAIYGEAFGLYVIEALACGVPVVQPRHGAFPELVEATGGGVLCEPQNPQSLADAVEELLCDAPAARAMGERGRQTVLNNFSVDRMAQEFTQVIDAVVNDKVAVTKGAGT